MLIDDVSGAASSATIEEVTNFKEMTQAQIDAYLTDGTVPQRETKEKPSDDGKPKPVESGAAPDAATKKEIQEPTKTDDDEPKRESRAERRIRKLTDERNQLRAELAKKSETQSPVSSTAKTDPNGTAPKRPRLKDFTDKIGAKDGYSDWDAAHVAYEDATDLFHEERQKTAVLDALKEQQSKLDGEKQKDLQKKETDKTAKSFADRASTFAKTLKEDNFAQLFVEVKTELDEKIKTNPQFDQVSQILVESEVGPELVYYLGQHPDVLDDLLDMPLPRALREIGRLEVSDKIKAPTPKTITAAKKKTPDVSGSHASPEDPLEKAVEEKNMVKFIEESNKRETTRPAIRWGH